MLPELGSCLVPEKGVMVYKSVSVLGKLYSYC